MPGLPIIVLYASGTVLSSFLVFSLARRNGRKMLRSRLVRRFFPRRYQLKAGIYIRHYGILTLVFCKFIPGINTVSLIMGGAMGLKGALAYFAIGATGVAANVIYFTAGLLIGNNLPNLVGFSKKISLLSLLLGIAAVSGAACIFQLRRNLLKKARKAHAGGQ